MKNKKPPTFAVPDLKTSNEDMIAGQLASDPPSWREFIARLQRYVGARVEPAVRDDVVGDILLRLVQQQEKLLAARDPMAWVMRVAANALIDHYRRRSVEKRAVDAFASEPGETETNPFTDSSAADEFNQCLVPFLESLDETYREALRLVEIDGMSQIDAAKQLGLSPSGMKSRVQRGRAKLKQRLLQCCNIEVDRRGGILTYHPRGRDCSEGCDN